MGHNRRILGHRRSGAPIYAIAGGDATNTLAAVTDMSDAELTEERSRILGALSTATPAEVDALVARSEQVATEVESRNAAAQRASEARSRLAGAVPTVPQNAPGGPAVSGQPGGTQPEQRGGQANVARRLGVQVIESPSLAEFRSRGMSGNANMDLEGVNIRALIDSSSTSGGALTTPNRVPDLIPVTRDVPIRLLDLIDTRPTDGPRIEYVQEDVFTNSAAEVAEGAVKPESGMTMKVVEDTTKTVAHWVNLTRQTAEDNSQLQSYVEGRLTYGLLKRLENQVLRGNGTSPNMRGIWNTTGVGTYTASANEAAVISVRKAITVAQLSEFQPDTVVMNPVDWERIELSTDTAGSFRVTPSVANLMAPRVWGLAVITTMVMTGTTGGGTPVGGEFLVGSFREGATLWEQSGIRLLMTDSHASNFTSNILTLLAEMRAGLSVWRPKAFVKGAFSGSAN